MLERLLVVRCPTLLDEDDHGRAARRLGVVTEAVATFSPLAERVRAGTCAVPTRGPSRYFGGDEALARAVGAAVAALDLPVGVGVADGLFAAGLAAAVAADGDGAPTVVPPGDTPRFLAPWPVDVLERPELADLLRRLGIRTLGDFAALPRRHVLARFGADGDRCHRVARGLTGEAGDGAAGRRRPRPAPPGARQPGFWGSVAGADAQAAEAARAVQRLLGPEAVRVARLGGGRGPAERARTLPWGGRAAGAGGDGDGDGDGRDDPAAPWPGQLPPPSPATVCTPPRPVELLGAGGAAVAVTGRGDLTTAPARLAVDGGGWETVTAWAGPWPADERWWAGRRRRARLQVVAGRARLLTRERGRWWLEGVYD